MSIPTVHVGGDVQFLTNIPTHAHPEDAEAERLVQDRCLLDDEGNGQMIVKFLHQAKLQAVHRQSDRGQPRGLLESLMRDELCFWL